MSRALKFAAALIGLLVAALIVAAIAVPSIVNKFKPDIERIAKEQTGMTLSLQGDIGLSIFPILGVSVESVKLTQPDGNAFASIDQMRASLALLPLLKGEISVDKVIVSGMALQLEKNNEGKGNWETITETQAALATNKQPTPAATEKTAPSSETGSNLPELNIALVEITDTHLKYNDLATGQAASLDDFDLTLKNINFGTYFPVTLSFKVQNKSPELTLSTELNTQVKISKDIQHIDIQALTTRFNAVGEPTQGKNIEATLATNASIDLTHEKVEIPDLSLAINNLKLKAKISVEKFSAPTIAGQIEIAEFSPKSLMSTLGLPAIETTDASALSKTTFKTNINVTPELISLEQLTLLLDQTVINGSASYELANQHANASIKGNILDLTRYMPPPSAASVTAPSATKTAQSQAKQTQNSSQPQNPAQAATSTQHPFAALKTLNLNAALTFDKIIVPGHTLENINLVASGKNGLLELSKANVTLDGEKMQLNASVNAQQPDADTIALFFSTKGKIPDLTFALEASSLLKADAEFSAIELRNLRTNAQIAGKVTSGKEARLKLQSQIKADLKEQTVAVSSTSINLNNLAMEMNLQLQGFEAPQLSGVISVPPFSAKQLMASLGQPPIETSSPTALTKVGFSTQLNGPANEIQMNNMAITLDKTLFTGTARYNLADQSIFAELNGDALNADEYLPPESDAEKEAALPIPTQSNTSDSNKADPNAPEPDLLPIETLRALNADVRFKLKKLTIKEYVTENMEIAVTAKDGLIELTKANASLYDGTLTTSASVDARGERARYAFKNTVANVNADKFPKSLTRQEFLFGLLKIQPQGLINIKTEYASEGNKMSQVIESAKASMDLHLEKGALEELKLLSSLYQLAAMFDENVTDTSKLVAATPFKDLETQFSLDGSKLTHNKYALKLNRDAHINGSGNIDLLKRTLKYKFDLTPTDHFIQKESKWADALRDLPLAYTCEANLFESMVPNCGVEKAALTAAAKKVVERKLKLKAEQKLDKWLDKQKSDKPEEEKTEKEQQKDALKDAGKELLKGLFK